MEDFNFLKDPFIQKMKKVLDPYIIIIRRMINNKNLNASRI